MAQFEQGHSGNPETQFKSGQKAEESGRKGGVASGESKRQKKSLKNALQALLEMDHRSKSGEVKSGYEVIAIGLYNKAMKGDTKAVKLMAELVEEYRQKVDLSSGGQPFELKVVQTSEDIKDKVNEYLNGGFKQ